MTRYVLFPALILIFLFHSCENSTEIGIGNLPVLGIDNCLKQPGESGNLEIVTWNVREFPLHGEKTIQLLAELVRKIDPDVIALQETVSESALKELVSLLEGWEVVFRELSDLNPAFIYKTSEVTLIGEPVYLFGEEPDAFPRPPVFITVEHHTGMRVFLLNVHLKCCSGSENEERRRKAGNILKSFIDERLPEEKVLILGDFNDEISPHHSPENVFYNFIVDSLNYRFLDMGIAAGNPELWSYPGWPSHIDHFLATNELFSADHLTEVLAFDRCDSSYFDWISDHRPVILKILRP